MPANYRVWDLGHTHFMSLSLSSLICKMGLTPILQDDYKYDSRSRP